GRLSRSAHLDGSIYTQTLFVRKLAIAGGTHSVIFLGTENDSVYALDADDPAKVLWKRSFIDPANGITPADGSFGGHRHRAGGRSHRDAGDRSHKPNPVCPP